MNDAQRYSDMCSVVEQAIALEQSYKEMLHQGDEIDQRIQLWRHALDICKTSSEPGHLSSAYESCALLGIPAIFSSGTLAHLHSSAHISILQYRLAEALGHRYNHSFRSIDIDERISLCRSALVFLRSQPSHISPAPAMASLGAALYMRFALSSRQDELQESFELLSSAVKMYPSEPYYLADFGQLLMRRYQASGSVDDLNESLVVLQRAYNLRIGHPARGRICRLIGAATLLKDGHLGIRMDVSLEYLRELYKEALTWQPFGHHSHFEGWDGLSMIFLRRFLKTSSMHDLNRAINFCQTAYIMLNPQHSRAFRFSTNLSNSLTTRYELLGDFADHELAIFHARRAVDIGPEDRRPLLLVNLANLLITAVEYSGDIEILSEAISLARKALDSVHESSRSSILLKLGRALIVKASLLGDNEALTEGTHHLRQLLKCVDKGMTLYIEGARNASRALLQQHEIDPSRYPQCLDEAIQLLEGLARQELPEAYREDILLWTGTAHRARYRSHRLLSDLELALASDQRALDLSPVGHRLRYLCLAAVSEDLALWYDSAAKIGAENFRWERALQMQQEALKELKDGHPDHPRMTIALAKLFLIPDTPYMDCEKAFSLLRSTLRHLHSNVYRCIVDSISVLNSVETQLVPQWRGDELARQRCLEVYQELINLLPRLASLDMDLARRILVLSQARDLATRASSHAIQLLQFDHAIEILEAGRAVFWAQHLRLRNSFELLDVEIAKELRTISRRLEVAAGLNIPPTLDDNLAQARMDKIMADRRRLSARFDELVDQVRLKPGMDRFLRNLDYAALSSAAIRGPVAIFQASWICVIVAPHTSPQIIPLHEVNNEWLKHAANTIRLCAGRSRSKLDDRGAMKRPLNGIMSRNSEEYDILAEIWCRIIQPLLVVLGWKKQEGRERPRLFLCPTGMFSFLPIHAAGLYHETDCAEQSQWLSDYCVVSYTPTLGALLASQTNSRHARRDVRLLLAAAPEPFTSTALPAARDEVQTIRYIVPSNFILGSEASGASESDSIFIRTAEDVLRRLSDATILHLACHGLQNASNPLQSGFIMHDKMMEVADLIRLNLPNARLAFLSACETAQGDMERPDEVLHLAATMLYTGFKSVVGTMWSMGDVDGPVVANTVYGELFGGESEELHFDVVPYALDAAVRELRAQGLEPSRWAPYIHIGM